MLEQLHANIRKDLFIIALGMFFSILLAAFFLNASGLAWADFLSLSFDSMKEKVISLNFFLFLLFFSLSLGFACFSALRGEFKSAAFNIMLGVIPALAISFFTIPLLQDYLLLFLFYPLGLAALVFTVSVKSTEIKRFPLIRSFYSGIGTFTMILAIGFFVFGAIEIYPEQETYLQAMEASLASGITGSDMQGQIVQANLRTQYQLLWNILNSPQYQSLNSVDDEKVQEFNVYYLGIIAGLNKAIDNPEEFMDASGMTLGQETLDTHGLLEKSIPGYDIFTDYFFILYPLLLFTMIISIGNIIFRIFGTVFGFLLYSLLKTI